jgi:hypothetical protein
LVCGARLTDLRGQVFFRSLSVFYRFQSRGLECEFSHSRGLPSHEAESVRNTGVVVRIHESCSCQVTMQMHRPAVSTVYFVQPISIKQFINLHILFRRASSSSRHQRLLFCLRCCLLLFRCCTMLFRCWPLLISLLSYAISLLYSAISLLSSSTSLLPSTISLLHSSILILKFCYLDVPLPFR